METRPEPDAPTTPHRTTTEAPPSLDCLIRSGPELLVLLRRLRFSHQDAEDAVQGTLIRGVQWLRSGRGHELKDWCAWLRTVAVRAARTIARRRKWVALSEADGPWVTPSDAVERREEHCVRLVAVSEAIERLRPALRALIDFCTVRGNTIRAAAREFGMPASTVRRRLVEALRIVRADLRSRGFDVPETPAKKRKSCARTRGARL